MIMPEPNRRVELERGLEFVNRLQAAIGVEISTPQQDMAERIRRIKLVRGLQFDGGLYVVILAQKHQRQVKACRRVFGIEVAGARQLIFGLLQIARFEVGHTQVMAELWVARPPRNGLLPKNNGFLQLAGVDVLQQLIAGLGLRLGKSSDAQKQHSESYTMTMLEAGLRSA